MVDFIACIWLVGCLWVLFLGPEVLSKNGKLSFLSKIIIVLIFGLSWIAVYGLTIYSKHYKGDKWMKNNIL